MGAKRIEPPEKNAKGFWFHKLPKQSFFSPPSKSGQGK
jgi:hypothetical protein